MSDPLQVPENESIKQRSLTERTLSGFAWMFSGSIASFILQLVVTMVLARLLSPSDFGLLSAALVIVYFAAMFSSLGMGPALIQRQELDEKHIDTGFTANLVFSFSIGLLIYGFAPFIAGLYKMPELVPILRALSLLFPIRGFAGLSEALLKRTGKFRQLASANITSFFWGYGVVAIVLSYFGRGVWSLVFATLVQATLNSFLLYRHLPHAIRFRFDRGIFRDLIGFGGGVTAANFANYLARQGDNFIVGRWLGAEALGYYGKAYSLMLLPTTQLTSILDQVLFPILSKVQDETRKLKLAHKYGISTIALTMMPLSVISFVLAPELIGIVYGSEWELAVKPFQILCLSMFFRSAYKICASVIIARGKVKSFTQTQVIYGTMVILGALVGQKWGIEGVAIGTTVAIIVNYLMLSYYSLKIAELSWKEFLSCHLPGLGLSIVLLTIVLGIASILRAVSLPDYFVIILPGIAVSFVVLVIIWKPNILGSQGMWLRGMITQHLMVRVPRRAR